MTQTLEQAQTSIAFLRGTVDAEKMKPRQRLLYLRDFLRSGIIPDNLWRFTHSQVRPECRTAGCTCGWWDFLTYTPHKDAGEGTWVQSYNGWSNPFGLTEQEFNRCFTPALNPEYKDRGCVLPPFATPMQVADEIDRMLEERKLRRKK